MSHLKTNYKLTSHNPLKIEDLYTIAVC